MLLGLGVRELSTTALGEEGAEADVENESLLDLGEVALLVEVGRVGDDPPTGLLAVNVVELVASTEDAPGTDCLDEGGLVVGGGLAVDVLADGSFVWFREVGHGA